MRVSTKGRYALRVVTELAIKNREVYTPLKIIAERQNVSVKYLEQIIGMLLNAGIVSSIRGPQGGYKLVKDPKDYTVGDILRVSEGELSVTPCVVSGNCDNLDSCMTKEFWIGFQKNITDYLDSITIEDLVKNHKAKVGYEYII